MSHELSPAEQEELQQSRNETAMDLVMGGAESARDAGAKGERLHLSDKQLESMKQDEEAKLMLEKLESLTVDLPDEVDQEKLHSARVEAGLEGLTEAEIDQVLYEKFKEAEELHEALLEAFKSVTTESANADVVVAMAEEDQIWTLFLHDRYSRPLHIRASEKVRRQIKLPMIQEYEKRIGVLKRIKDSLRLNLE